MSEHLAVHVLPLTPGRATRRVLVLGAGLAGLTAAYELRQAGHDVTVLEAQTRPGGRVRTLRAPFADGLYAEAGAARIPDGHRLTLEYAKRFGLELAPFYPTEGESSVFLRGRTVRTKPGTEPNLSLFPISITAEERALGLDGLFRKAFGTAIREAAEASVWPPESLKRFDQMNIRQVLAQAGLSPDAFEALGLTLFTDQYSALEAIQVVAGRHGSGRMLKIVGGNDRLPAAFARHLGDAIRYSCPVVRIEQDRAGVRAIVERDGTRQTFSADKLICTIPFPVLRSMQIEPPLSPGKRRAIAEMAYASLSRITFQVRRRYWLDQGLSGFAVTDIPGEVWHPTFDQPGPRGLLQVYLEVPSSLHASSLSEEERIRYATDAVERVFPGLRENLESVASLCWDHDPWVRGGTRLMHVGQVATLHPRVATPEGHIHFAGEHTSRWFVWMNGAIESGLKVAREVHEA